MKRENILEIEWPLGEPMGTVCQFGSPILAPKRFLEAWEGAETKDYLEIMLANSSDWCNSIRVGNSEAWLFGDVPGCFFPGIGRWTGSPGKSDVPVLAFFKWVAAPEDYGLPTVCRIAPNMICKELYSTSWMSEGDQYYFCCSDDAGQEVLARGNVPIFRFRPGPSTIEVHELTLPSGLASDAEFELYLFSDVLLGYEWIPPKDDEALS